MAVPWPAQRSIASVHFTVPGTPSNQQHVPQMHEASGTSLWKPPGSGNCSRTLHIGQFFSRVLKTRCARCRAPEGLTVNSRHSKDEADGQAGAAAAKSSCCSHMPPAMQLARHCQGKFHCMKALQCCAIRCVLPSFYEAFTPNNTGVSGMHAGHGLPEPAAAKEQTRGHSPPVHGGLRCARQARHGGDACRGCAQHLACMRSRSTKAAVLRWRQAADWVRQLRLHLLPAGKEPRPPMLQASSGLYSLRGSPTVLMASPGAQTGLLVSVGLRVLGLQHTQHVQQALHRFLLRRGKQRNEHSRSTFEQQRKPLIGRDTLSAMPSS